MNISLTPQLEDLLKQKVATGMYNSVSEVVREALRLLSEKDNIQAMKLEALKKEISQGIESLDKAEDRPFDIESIKAKGRKKLAASKNA